MRGSDGSRRRRPLLPLDRSFSRRVRCRAARWRTLSRQVARAVFDGRLQVSSHPLHGIDIDAIPFLCSDRSFRFLGAESGSERVPSFDALGESDRDSFGAFQPLHLASEDMDRCGPECCLSCPFVMNRDKIPISQIRKKNMTERDSLAAYSRRLGRWKIFDSVGFRSDDSG